MHIHNYTKIYVPSVNIIRKLIFKEGENSTIVQQGMNHDKPYFSNMSGANMLIFMTNYYTFL